VDTSSSILGAPGIFFRASSRVDIDDNQFSNNSFNFYYFKINDMLLKNIFFNLLLFIIKNEFFYVLFIFKYYDYLIIKLF
jgi:hypothetical protein